MDEMRLETLDQAEEEIEGESKEEKFRRIASKRTNNILKQIDNLGKLAGSSAYEYNQEQIEKIFAAIQKAVDTAHAKFQPMEDFTL